MSASSSYPSYPWSSAAATADWAEQGSAIPLCEAESDVVDWNAISTEEAGVKLVNVLVEMKLE